MEFLYLGKIVNTHGIKGEIRILSDFKYKSEIFKKNNRLYIGNDYIKETINTYRIHKNYDMVSFVGINDINDVLKYKGKNVYFDRNAYNFDGILYEDLIDLEVYNRDVLIGKVDSIIKSNAHPILVVKDDLKETLIPYIDQFIKDVDLNRKRIDVELIEGMLNEN